MVTRKRIRFSEKQAALIWQQALGKELTSTEDELIKVIYPGRINRDEGPDFRDAVIVNNLRLTKGDVEVHVRSSDWYNHQHHTDAAYNNVILHVAIWHDCNSATLLQSGKPTPLLCLAKALGHQAYLLPYALPCFRILDRMDGQTLAKILNTAGEERFAEKATHFQTQLRLEEAGQVLYRGMMRALGYAKNTKPFEDLADRLPLAFIESTEGLAVKQALMLGTAGLLRFQRRQSEFASEREVRELEQIWQSVGAGVKAMNEDDWNLSRVYPNNSPVRRIIAQSYLLEHCSERKLLPSMLQLVKEAHLPRGHPALENALIVAGDGYWSDHFDFGIRSETKLSALLGNSKAREIAINVILPFAFSWGILTNDAKLTGNATRLYDNYPKLAEHCLTRHMARQLGLDNSFAYTARRQQGLIHIFKTDCCRGACAQCPLVG